MKIYLILLILLFCVFANKIPNKSDENLELISTLKNGRQSQIGASKKTKRSATELEMYNLYRLYGAGVEYSFPPIFEMVLQKLQSRFSVYKYHDDSRPVSVTSFLTNQNKH